MQFALLLCLFRNLEHKEKVVRELPLNAKFKINIKIGNDMKIQLKVKRKNLLTDVLYVLFVLCYLIVLLIWGMGSSFSQIRYYILIFATVVAGVSLILEKKSKIYGKNLLLVVPLGLLFLAISLQRAREAQHALLFRTYVQISLIVLPALYAMFLLNLLKMESLIKLMEMTLICTVLVYFWEPGHGILDFLNIKNWMGISIIHSRSFTESDICSETFFNLFLFFNFYRNASGKEINSKYTKVFYNISLIFTVLCFKRLAMLVVVCVIILNKVIDWRGSISKHFAPVMALFFSIATVLYTELMKGNLFPGFDIYNFTTGRNYIFSLWQRKNYMSYGYGSSMVLIGRYLEMDLVQMYLELNIIAVFVFAYVYFKIARANVYSILIMTYAFLNMLTASSLPGSLSWIVAFLTIASISSDKCKQENMDINEEKSHIKKLFSKRKGTKKNV